MSATLGHIGEEQREAPSTRCCPTAAACKSGAGRKNRRIRLTGNTSVCHRNCAEAKGRRKEKSTCTSVGFVSRSPSPNQMRSSTTARLQQSQSFPTRELLELCKARHQVSVTQCTLYQSLPGTHIVSNNRFCIHPSQPGTLCTVTYTRAQWLRRGGAEESSGIARRAYSVRATYPNLPWSAYIRAPASRTKSPWSASLSRQRVRHSTDEGVGRGLHSWSRHHSSESFSCQVLPLPVRGGSVLATEYGSRFGCEAT